MTILDIETLNNLSKNDNNVTSVLHKGNWIGGIDLTHLSEALAKNTTLTSLTLIGPEIGKMNMAGLTKLLSNKSLPLKFLSLIGNQIGKKIVQELACALSNNLTLTSLTLVDNKIGNQGAIALADALTKNNMLTSLDLRENHIRDEGAKALAKGLLKNNTLKCIDLKGNYLSDVHYELISLVIKKDFDALKILIGKYVPKFDATKDENIIILSDIGNAIPCSDPIIQNDSSAYDFFDEELETQKSAVTSTPASCIDTYSVPGLEGLSLNEREAELKQFNKLSEKYQNLASCEYDKKIEKRETNDTSNIGRAGEKFIFEFLKNYYSSKSNSNLSLFKNHRCKSGLTISAKVHVDIGFNVKYTSSKNKNKTVEIIWHNGNDKESNLPIDMEKIIEIEGEKELKHRYIEIKTTIFEPEKKSPAIFSFRELAVMLDKNKDYKVYRVWNIASTEPHPEKFDNPLTMLPQELIAGLHAAKDKGELSSISHIGFIFTPRKK